MAVVLSSVVPFPREEVFAWHGRPGALERLLPPWLPLRVVASSPEGRAVISLPGGLRWVLQHRAEGEDGCGWRQARSFSTAEGSSTLVEDSVETLLPAAFVRRVLAYGHRQLAGDLSAFGAARDWPPPDRAGRRLTVALTGASGLIGTGLAAFLSSGGHSVVRLVRRVPAGPGERRWDPLEPAPGLFTGIDAVVHLAGAPIGRRFSEQHKKALWESRVGPTERLARAAARDAAGGDGPSCFVCASAVGFYGYDRGSEVLDEGSGQGDGFLAKLVGAWEVAASPAAEAGLRVVTVRTGVAQSPRGGMLGLLYPVFLAGLGARLGNGQQWLSWIGTDDLLDVYLRALADERMSGPVNAVSPAPVNNSVYTKALAGVLHRPAFLSVPGVAASLVLGGEGAREFALSSQRAVPAVLERLGHKFRYPRLEDCLRHVLGRSLPP